MQSKPEPLKIIIADDHELIRLGFIEFMEKAEGLNVVAGAANGRQLISLAGIHEPEIILVDVHMPEVNGIEATRIITQQYPRTAAIGFSICREAYLIADLLVAGAKGYVLKDSHPAELLAAIKAVSKGENYYCPAATEIINNKITGKLYDPETGERKYPLTPRETEVLRLICQQKTNQEISLILRISVRTVEDFRRNLLDKTKSQHVAGLVTFAMMHGIYNPEDAAQREPTQSRPQR